MSSVKETFQLNSGNIYTLSRFKLASKVFLGSVKNSLLKANIPYDLNPIVEKFGHFLLDEQHGINHSFHVFLRAKGIRDSEGMKDQVTDEDLFIRALLHDAGEFLTNRDRNKASFQHQLIMSAIVTYTGRVLNLSDTNVIASDIFHHDDNFYQPTKEHSERINAVLSPAGKIIADADSLVFDMQKTIERNRTGSLGRWYFFRQDLTKEDRTHWRSRTKGLYDGLCALLPECNGPEHWFYTRTGKLLNEERKKEFKSELIKYYSGQYRTHWDLLRKTIKGKGKIEFGLRGDKRQLVPILPEDIKRQNFYGLTIEEQITQLIVTPVSAFQEKDSGRNYYGYSIRTGGGRGRMDRSEYFEF